MQRRLQIARKAARHPQLALRRVRPRRRQLPPQLLVLPQQLLALGEQLLAGLGLLRGGGGR